MATKGALLLVLSISLGASSVPEVADSAEKNTQYPLPSGSVTGLPPGLAKKPGGMPPGQYKKIYRRGEKLPRDCIWITDYDHWRLPPLAPGQGYARYDGEVYRVARDTLIVIEAIGIVSDLLR